MYLFPLQLNSLTDRRMGRQERMVILRLRVLMRKGLHRPGDVDAVDGADTEAEIEDTAVSIGDTSREVRGVVEAELVKEVGFEVGSGVANVAVSLIICCLMQYRTFSGFRGGRGGGEWRGDGERGRGRGRGRGDRSGMFRFCNAQVLTNIIFVGHHNAPPTPA